MQELEMIAALSNAFGPSGFEDDAVAVARSYAPEGFDLEEDSLRNLYIRRAEADADKPVVMLDAHSDEVGFMLQAIRPDGTLKFIPLGGWTPSNIPAHRVKGAPGMAGSLRESQDRSPRIFSPRRRRTKPPMSGPCGSTSGHQAFPRQRIALASTPELRSRQT